MYVAMSAKYALTLTHVAMCVLLYHRYACTLLTLCLQNAIPVRGDPHILVVGDPGLGKSQVSSDSYVHTMFIHTYVPMCMYIHSYVSSIHTQNIKN